MCRSLRRCDILRRHLTTSGQTRGSDLPFNFIVEYDDADRQLARKGFVGNHNAKPTAASAIATVTQKYL
jgi:hypothetical protein